MNFLAAIVAIVVAFLGGGGLAVAIITTRTEKWKFKAARAAEKEDRAEAKADQTAEIVEENRLQEERLERLENLVDALVKGQQSIMLDRVIYLGQSYIKRGSVKYEERARLRAMHNVYHYDLGGNGDADWVMSAVDELPLEH